MKLRRNIVITAVSLALMGAGFTGVAVASGGGDSPSTSQTSTQDDDENEGQEGKEAKEAPGDQARQDAACEKAGVPLTATNIDYDDETGICKLDSGDDEGSDEGGEDGGDE